MLDICDFIRDSDIITVQLFACSVQSKLLGTKLTPFFWVALAPMIVKVVAKIKTLVALANIF